MIGGFIMLYYQLHPVHSGLIWHSDRLGHSCTSVWKRTYTKHHVVSTLFQRWLSGGHQSSGDTTVIVCLAACPANTIR